MRALFKKAPQGLFPQVVRLGENKFQFLSIGIAIAIAIILLVMFLMTESLRTKAQRAFLFSFPTVEHNHYLEKIITAVGLNRFLHYSELGNKAIITPNVDTLYSQAVISLIQGPVKIHLPVIRDRYYSLQFIDMLTNNFSYISTRTNPSHIQDFTIVYDETDVKNKSNTIISPSQVVLVLVRIHVKNPEDLKTVQHLQQQITIDQVGDSGRIQQISYYNAKHKLDARQYWNNFLELYQYTTPVASMTSTIDAITLGLNSEEQIEEITNGFYDAQQKIQTDMTTMCSPLDHSNKWFSTEDQQCTDPDLVRSIIAWQYVYANIPEEARYYATYKDANGLPLNGDSIYSLDLSNINVDADLLPDGFWSVTVYNTDGYLIDNKWKRYSVNNGSIDGNNVIYFAPIGQLTGKIPFNVIPTAGAFYVVFRIYLSRHSIVLPGISRWNKSHI